MPWKETGTSEERLKFFAEMLSGDATMADLCRRFGVSRKTGYKWKKRYELGGTVGLIDLSRRPHNHPSAIPQSRREHIFEVRQKHPTWGARRYAPGYSAFIPPSVGRPQVRFTASSERLA